MADPIERVLAGEFRMTHGVHVKGFVSSDCGPHWCPPEFVAWGSLSQALAQYRDLARQAVGQFSSIQNEKERDHTFKSFINIIAIRQRGIKPC